MSDEYQPNEVVESQPEPEMMPARPTGEPTSENVPANDGDGVEASTARLDAEPEVLEAVEPAPPLPPSVTQPMAEGAYETPPAVGESEPVREVAFAVTPSADPAVAESPDPAPTSTVVSIADLEAPRRTKRESDGLDLSGVTSFLQERWWIVAGAVALLLVVFLFLPPISLAARLGGGGYTVLDDATTSVAHPDGLTVSRTADATGRLRIKLGSVPRADFEAGSVPDALSSAVAAVPDYLEPKSPYYTIDVKSKDPVGGTMTVVIPNESEPWDTLDLYAWDGEAWQWLPAQLDRDGETLVSQVGTLPTSVMVMQSTSSVQHIVTEVETWPAGGLDAAITEADVPGVLIGTMGGTTGSVTDLPAASAGGKTLVVPTVRNWLPGRDANWQLVSDMVSVEADRATHVANLVKLAQDGSYPGLVVDYQHVQSQDRAAFSAFISELGAACADAGLGLAVVVDEPQQAADGTWDTGGYDWAALGASVDQLRFVMPLSPSAYVPGGEVESLITWAMTQVDRHKLVPTYSTLSTDGEQSFSLDAVLSSLGQVQVQQTITESVLPGTKVNLSLGDGAQVETDATTQATQVVIGDQHYWLGTPQWLLARMDLSTRYMLGGALLRNLFDSGNVAGLMASLSSLQSDGSGSALPNLDWQVTDPAGKQTQVTTPLSQPDLAWTAPEITGTYKIAATVGSLDKGSLQILVSAPAPVVTETVAGGDAGTEEGTTVNAETSTEPDATLKASFVSDVSVPDNTHFEKAEAFTKTWRLRNSGDVDWPEGTVLAFASGDQLGADSPVEVGVVKAGEDVDISVDMTAPDEDGSFKSVWELSADGKSISGGSAYVLIQVGEQVATPTPETPAQPVVAPQPVASGSFELGGHIRDLGMPYADKMHYAGMTWVKIQVHYGEGAASIINAAHNAGFKIQLSAIGGAAMSAQDGFMDKFASWTANLASQGADAIEVWNEPNIDREWQTGLISPQSYTQLLCKSYNAIKGANGGTAVISAAPAPTGWFGGCGGAGCDDQPWMEGIYAAGAANCMDYIGAHHNSGATSPSATIGHPANPTDTHHSWFFLPQTQLYYNIFHGTRQIFYTEMGYASQEGVPTFSDQFAWARGTDNAEQAAWLAEAVQLSVSTGMVRTIIVWNIDFVRYGYDPQDGYAIIRPGGSCPACDSLHAVLGTR